MIELYTSIADHLHCSIIDRSRCHPRLEAPSERNIPVRFLSWCNLLEHPLCEISSLTFLLERITRSHRSATTFESLKQGLWKAQTSINWHGLIPP